MALLPALVACAAEALEPAQSPPPPPVDPALFTDAPSPPGVPSWMITPDASASSFVAALAPPGADAALGDAKTASAPSLGSPKRADPLKTP